MALPELQARPRTPPAKPTPKSRRARTATVRPVGATVGLPARTRQQRCGQPFPTSLTPPEGRDRGRETAANRKQAGRPTARSKARGETTEGSLPPPAPAAPQRFPPPSFNPIRPAPRPARYAPRHPHAQAGVHLTRKTQPTTETTANAGVQQTRNGHQHRPKRRKINCVAGEERHHQDTEAAGPWRNSRVSWDARPRTARKATARAR
jgi:hypothetical protein